MSITIILSDVLTKMAGLDIDDVGRRILTKAVLHGENLGKQRSPVDTGRLRNSITHRVDGARQAAYGTNVHYAIYLDQPRTRTPHYRGGPHGGSETAGWLSDTDVMVEREIISVFIPDEERRIEASW